VSGPKFSREVEMQARERYFMADASTELYRCCSAVMTLNGKKYRCTQTRRGHGPTHRNPAFIERGWCRHSQTRTPIPNLIDRANSNPDLNRRVGWFGRVARLVATRPLPVGWFLRNASQEHVGAQ